MNHDETVAVVALLGMKQSVVQSPTKNEKQSNIGRFHELFLPGSASIANDSTKSSKHSHTKRSNGNRSRLNRSQSQLSHKSAEVKVKTDIRAKKPKLTSPVSVMDTASDGLHQLSRKGKPNMASASLLPMLSKNKLESSHRTMMSTLSPKTDSHTLHSGVTLNDVVTFHQDTPSVIVTEQAAVTHINTVPFWRQDVQECQGSSQLVSTQDIVSALLAVEIQKMKALVNAKQKELLSANHVRDCITTAALFNQTPILSGPTSSSLQSMQSLFQNQIPSPSASASSPRTNSKDCSAAGLGNDCPPTNHMDGITNALLLNLLQQAIASKSFV